MAPLFHRAAIIRLISVTKDSIRDKMIPLLSVGLWAVTDALS